MKIEKIYVKPGLNLSKRISQWAFDNNIECLEAAVEEELNGDLEGLVILNQNQDIERDDLEIRRLFDLQQKPVQRIDINGTLMVGVSNFSLWLERNGCKNVLMVGSESLIENPNLERYLESMKLN